MKHQCSFCNKKAQRSCPVKETYICSKCCGTKRKKEINCDQSCQYLPDPNTEIWNEINAEVARNFNDDEEDILIYDFDVLDIARYFERFIFWYSKELKALDDDTIYKAIQKLYALSTEKIQTMKPESEFEEQFLEVYNKVPYTEEEDKKLIPITLLRMLKSITNVTNGPFGNKSYTVMLAEFFK